MENVLNLGQDQNVDKAFVSRATDPVVSNVATPADFSAQFPTPLDVTEILTLCEEINVWRAIPEKRTALKQETWREMTSLAFTSGSSWVSFTDGACPEEFTHNGSNTTVDLKNIGAKKSLTISDIMHSAAVAAAGWNGINQLVDGFSGSEGIPGGTPRTPFSVQHITDVKAKEMILAATLVMNGWDRLLVQGNAGSNSLEFSGIETQVTSGNGAHVNSSPSGTFSAATFDAFLAEACAKPTHIFGAPQTIQSMLSAYFQLGFQGSQLVNFPDGNRIVPGFNFAGEVNTGVGRLIVVADNNFTHSNSSGTTFEAPLYALRMSHNGEPLVYKSTQIPLAFKDLAPGCTAISFQIWAKTALIIKAMCAHSVFRAQHSGTVTTTCTQIG